MNGHVHLVFNLGDGPVRVRDTSRVALNDNKWHSVTVGRPSARQHTLMVDDNVATVTNNGNNQNMDLQGNFYLGLKMFYSCFDIQIMRSYLLYILSNWYSIFYKSHIYE